MNCCSTDLSQRSADFCHDTLDVFFSAAIFTQNPQSSSVNPATEKSLFKITAMYHDPFNNPQTRQCTIWQSRIIDQLILNTVDLRNWIYQTSNEAFNQHFLLDRLDGVKDL